MITADKLNAALRDDAEVVVSTYTKATRYTKKHAGWFYTGKDGNLYVKSGKRANCLSFDSGKSLLVSIRAFK